MAEPQGQPQQKGNGRVLMAILLSFVLLVAGLGGALVIHQLMQKQTLTASSKLGATPAGDGKAGKGADGKDVDPDLKSIIHENQKQVVLLQVKTENGEALGSGFLYNDKGDIITNGHVVSGVSKVRVKMADSTMYNGDVIGIGKDTDVAVVRVKELAGRQPMKLARAKEADIGDEVIAFGSPLGLENTVTTGIISGVNRDFTLENFQYKGVYQISAPIAPGNSGGPLVSKKTGEVLGINSAGSNQGSIGFSIPIDKVLPLVENWTENPGTSVPSAWKEQPTESQLTEGMIGDQKDFQDAATGLVNYFYSSIDTKDFVSAYSLLGSDWQGSLSYDTFRNGYLNTLGVGVTHVTPKKTGDIVVVTALVDARERGDDGKEQSSQYAVTYDVGIENNRLRILKGSAKKL
jgi:serine protease Do